ncbi:MAG: TraR/DksA family transcriptional regulator [Betaproteobacteria bacterium]
MDMPNLTIEKREALQATLAARAEILRSGIAQSLQGQDGGERGLVNHSEETDDDAIVDQEASMDVAQLSRATQELGEIEAALARLHAPEFGQCSACGADIPFARLQANPAALRCVGCQAEYERTRGETTHQTL